MRVLVWRFEGSRLVFYRRRLPTGGVISLPCTPSLYDPPPVRLASLPCSSLGYRARWVSGGGACRHVETVESSNPKLYFS